MQRTVSIIIPTHNRYKRLTGLLDTLSQQTYPMHLVEVIVVADGCKDETLALLKSYEAPYSLQHIELDGKGPAIGRNAGAAIANNELLLFVDDDIEPSTVFVAAHVLAHGQSNNRVVVGYLPYSVPDKPSFFHLQLLSWWEEKFQSMRAPGYWFNYEDLLSGNFSLSSQLFKKINQFDTSFRCREDYELGVRLIKSGADFTFSKEAWGYHRDEVTDLHRSHDRKRQEGKADIQFGIKHPELKSRLRLMRLKPSSRIAKRSLLLLICHRPAVSDYIARVLKNAMLKLEKRKWRSLWLKLNILLQDYWYLRGAMDNLKTRKNLQEFYKLPDASKTVEYVKLDIKEGLDAIEKKVDAIRPASVQLYYGQQFIGKIPYWQGAERLRGAHIRAFLATKLAWSTMQALTLEQALLLPATQNAETDFQQPSMIVSNQSTPQV